MRFELAHRLFFVAPHEARVAGDVRGQNGRKSPFVNVEPLRRLGHGVLYATLGLRAWKNIGGACRHRIQEFQTRSMGKTTYQHDENLVGWIFSPS
jgi:hypothetical protein